MPQLLQFSRVRRTQVDHIDETTVISNCSIQDNLTDAFLEITAKLPDLEITDIRAEVRRSPRAGCADGTAHLKKAIGIRIGAGMTEVMQGTLGDQVSCEELIFMLEECCHGIILSLTRDVLAKAPPDAAGKHAFFSEMVRKNIRMYNRCAAFAPGSSLVEGVAPPSK
jgi:hypothetical protein